MKTIALIEDDPDLDELLRYNLEKEGFRMAGYDSGKDALGFLRRVQPDLLVLDIMPPHTGAGVFPRWQFDGCGDVKGQVAYPVAKVQ